jgi:hypothetical protein
MAVVSKEILIALSEQKGNHDYLQITKQLLSYIESMCEGSIDLSDKQYKDNNENENEFPNHNPLTIEILNEIISNNFRYPSLSNDQIDLKTMPKIYELNKEVNEEIKSLIKEYPKLSNNDLKQIYLSRFLTISKEFKLFDNSFFTDFLKKEIEETQDKHILYDCFVILHNIIIIGKKLENEAFIKKIYQDFFPILKRYIMAYNEFYEHSYSKIYQIIDEFDFISFDESCEIYWTRLVKIVKKDGRKGFNGNKLYNCIVHLKKCGMKRKWRKWLVKSDGYEDVKQDILKEFYR